MVKKMSIMNVKWHGINFVCFCQFRKYTGLLLVPLYCKGEKSGPRVLWPYISIKSAVFLLDVK